MFQVILTVSFSSSIWFDHLAQLFCWCICRVLVLWIISCSLRKNCKSNIRYSLLLLVCNIFTRWEVVFDHIWKIDLIASIDLDFLCRKAILEEVVIKEYNHLLVLWIEQDEELKEIWVNQYKRLTRVNSILRKTALVHLSKSITMVNIFLY